MNSRQITIVPYQVEWIQKFEKEATLIQKALGKNCISIHHIGSTSISGLCSKPVIDIMPVVKDISAVDPVIPKMEALAYQSLGENGLLFRRFFIKGEKERTQHVHIFEEDNHEITRHLLFRDWMRTHPEDACRYAAIKDIEWSMH